MQYFSVGYNAKYVLCCINVLERLIIPLLIGIKFISNMCILFFNYLPQICAYLVLTFYLLPLSFGLLS